LNSALLWKKLKKLKPLNSITDSKCSLVVCPTRDADDFRRGEVMETANMIPRGLEVLLKRKTAMLRYCNNSLTSLSKYERIYVKYCCKI
jgi:hypothetical protein